MTMASFPGHALRARREELGLSYKDVFRVTRIQIEHLKALEEGNLRALPGPIYTLGFLQTYCECLDLNPHLYMDRFRACAQIEPQSVRPYSLLPQRKSGRPEWVDDLVTWGAICAVLLLGWLTYATVIRPFADRPEDRLDAAPIEEIAPPEHHFVEDF